MPNKGRDSDDVAGASGANGRAKASRHLQPTPFLESRKKKKTRAVEGRLVRKNAGGRRPGLARAAGGEGACLFNSRALNGREGDFSPSLKTCQSSSKKNRINGPSLPLEKRPASVSTLRLLHGQKKKEFKTKGQRARRVSLLN